MEVFDVIIVNKEIIGKFYKVIELIKRKIYEVEVKEKIKNMVKFIGEFNECIGKDVRVFVEFYRKGVDIRIV